MKALRRKSGGDGGGADRRRARLAVLAVATLCVALSLALEQPTASAHASPPSWSQIRIDEDAVVLRMFVERTHLVQRLALDADGNNVVDASELRAGREQVLRYLGARLLIRDPFVPCLPRGPLTLRDTGMAHVELSVRFVCRPSRRRTFVTNRVLSEERRHRMLGEIVEDGSSYRHLFSARRPEFRTPARPRASHVGGLEHADAGPVAWLRRHIASPWSVAALVVVAFLVGWVARRRARLRPPAAGAQANGSTAKERKS